MAEVFGVVTGAIGIAALFNNCVQCFEYVQLGRSFKRDFKVYRLQLDVAELRLRRWAQAVHLYEDHRFAQEAPEDERVQLAAAIVTELNSLIQAAISKANRYRMTARPEDLEACREQDMPSTFQKLHRRLRNVARESLRGPKPDEESTNTDTIRFLRKTGWALYDRRDFKHLVDSITELVESLEKLFSLDDVYKKLATEVIAHVDDETSLRALKQAALDTDSVLLEAIVQKGVVLHGKNFARDIRADGHSDIQVGSRYEASWKFPGREDNYVDTIDTKGTTKIQIGGRYGYST